MTSVRPTIATLVDQARAAASTSGATISRGEAVGILATAREMHLNQHDVEAALVAAGFSDPASLSGAATLRARQDESNLSSLGYSPGRIDGRGGATLEAAVRRFQHDNALPETGAIDSETRQRMEDMTASNQAMLAALGSPIAVDGLAGPATGAAVRAFQREHHLPATGVFDTRTTEALGAAYSESFDRGTADRAWATGRMGDLRTRIEELSTHARTPLTFEALVGATREQLASLVEAGALPRELATAANAYRGLANAVRAFENGGPGAAATLHMMHEVNDRAAASLAGLTLPGS